MIRNTVNKKMVSILKYIYFLFYFNLVSTLVIAYNIALDPAPVKIFFKNKIT